MLARFSSAILGLFAFSVTVVAGLVAGNSATATLSRSIVALIVFGLIGWVLGTAARAVIGEQYVRRERELQKRYDEAETEKPKEKEAPGTARASSG